MPAITVSTSQRLRLMPKKHKTAFAVTVAPACYASHAMGVFDLVARWHADRKIRKLLRGAPERSLTELSEHHFAKLVGRVHPHRARVLEAPLSGRLCEYYSIEVLGPHRSQFYERGGDRESNIVGNEEEAVPFELEVDGRRAVIDPTDAWISSAFDHRSTGTMDERARLLCMRLGLDRVSSDWAQLTFREAILGIGERIALFGAGVREPDHHGSVGEHGYRDDTPTRFRFSGSARFPLVIRDDVRSL
jgi:hypothetical protein